MMDTMSASMQEKRKIISAFSSRQANLWGLQTLLENLFEFAFVLLILSATRDAIGVGFVQKVARQLC